MALSEGWSPPPRWQLRSFPARLQGCAAVRRTNLAGQESGRRPGRTRFAWPTSERGKGAAQRSPCAPDAGRPTPPRPRSARRPDVHVPSPTSPNNREHEARVFTPKTSSRVVRRRQRVSQRLPTTTMLARGVAWRTTLVEFERVFRSGGLGSTHDDVTHRPCLLGDIGRSRFSGAQVSCRR